MERLWILVCLLLGIASCGTKKEEPAPPGPDTPSTLAFPGAEGGGMYATGGRGTSIHVIYSLEDNQDNPEPGTLRYALERASGPRVIVFAVAGRINLSFPIELKHGQVTILGQTAPGDGICVSGFPFIVTADDVVIRYMRFRMGDEMEVEGDALTVEKGHKNIILDHCSFSWSTDECCSVYGVENFTMQYCIISESLRRSVHVKGDHGYGGIWGGKNATYHHNLLAHHDSRNPRFDHDYVATTNVAPVDYINNVVYNWGGNSAYGGESSSTTGNQRQYNFINNYYKPGPATNSKVAARLLNPTTRCNNCTDVYGGSVVPGLFYVTGNMMYGSEAVTADNWSGVEPDESSKKSQCKSSSRFTFTNAYTNEQTAQAAYDKVLAKAGCSLKRDIVDTRIVDEVRNGNYTYEGSNGSTGGLIDSQSDVGGWPEYSGTANQDSDYDGIPDAWETAHGLNPKDRSDAVTTTLQSPYMNVEVYANDLVKALY